MTARCVTVLLLLLLATRGIAQNHSSSAESGCAGANGVAITVRTGDSSRVGDSTRTLLRLDQRGTVDTVWRFDIAERRWTRPSFFASIGAGWSSASGTTGMSTAPDTSAWRGDRAWHLCAGVAIGMREPTLVVRGARGQVHLRADVSALRRAGRAHGDTTSQPRR